MEGGKKRVKKALRKSKCASWREFISNQSNIKNFARMCKNIGRSQNTLGLVKSRDGTQANNPEESVNIVMDTFFPGSTDKAGKEDRRHISRRLFIA